MSSMSSSLVVCCRRSLVNQYRYTLGKYQLPLSSTLSPGRQQLRNLSDLPRGKTCLPVWTYSNSSLSHHHSSISCGHSLHGYGAFSAANNLYSFGNRGNVILRHYSTEPNQTESPHSNHSSATTTKGSQDGDFQLVYTAPLKSAIKAIKIFSLTTATAAVTGGPILVWLGNPSVPLSGRIIMSSLVMLVGISTTALLHWLVKGYVIRMYFDEETRQVRLYTLSVFGRRKLHEFHISEAGPPSATAFSSFQAKGKSYFVHAEVFKDRKVLSGLLGAYTDLETSHK